MFLIMIPLRVWPAFLSILLFFTLWLVLWRHLTGRSYYFDPQDFVHYEQGAGRDLPVAASTGTFESHMKNYVSVMNLLITVAAASIAFGATSIPKKVVIAKIFLGFAVLYGVVFSGLLQYFYDEYSQNVRAYTRFRYSLIQALGFSALVCFIIGYLVWSFELG